jgi:hypothetical protein
MQIPQIFNLPAAKFVFMEDGVKFPPCESGWQKPENGHTYQDACQHPGNVGFRAGDGYIGLDLDNPAAFEGLVLPPTTTWETRPGRFGKLFTGTVPVEVLAFYGKPADHSQFKLYKDGKVMGEIKLERCYQVIPNSWKTLDDGTVAHYAMVDSIPPAPIDLKTLMADILALPGVSLFKNPKSDTATCPNATVPVEALYVPMETSDTRDKAYANAALLSELAKVEGAPESTRYDQVYASGCALGELVGAKLLPYDATARALVEAGVESGLPKHKAIESAKHGMDKGVKNPRKIPAPKELWEATQADVDSLLDAVMDGVKPGMSQEEFDNFKLPEGPKFTFNLPPDHFLTRFSEYGKAISDAYGVYWFMAGLFMLGTVADKKINFVTTMDTFYANIWIYILGDSSLARKTTAVKKAIAMLRAVLGAKFADACIPNTFSPEAFIEHMSNYQHAPWIRDEAAGVLSIMQKDYMRGFKDDLMQLYDCSPITRMLRTKKNGQPSRFNVDDPYVNLFFASTGAALGYNLDLIDKETGFLVRFMFAYPQDEKENYMPLDIGTAAHSEFEEICISQLSTIHAQMAAIPECITMTHAPEAREYYNKWQETREKEAARLKDGYSSQIFSRLNPAVIKMAMLFEMGSMDFDPTRPIREEYFVEAARLVDSYFMPTTRAVYDLIGTANKDNQIEKIVLYLSRHGGKATRKEIMRDVKIKSKEMTEYLLTMDECEMIQIKPVYNEVTKRNTSYVFLNDLKVANVVKVVEVERVEKVESTIIEETVKEEITVSTLDTLPTMATLSTFQVNGVECKDAKVPDKSPADQKRDKWMGDFKKHTAKQKRTCHICGYKSEHDLIPDMSEPGLVGCYACTSCTIGHRTKDKVKAPAKTETNMQKTL